MQRCGYLSWTMGWLKARTVPSGEVLKKLDMIRRFCGNDVLDLSPIPSSKRTYLRREAWLRYYDKHGVDVITPPICLILPGGSHPHNHWKIKKLGFLMNIMFQEPLSILPEALTLKSILCVQQFQCITSVGRHKINRV